MNVSLLVLSSRRRILLRSLGYALGCGSSAGALTALLGAAVLAALEQNVSLLPLTLVLAPIAAAVGAVTALPCGLIAGLALVALRRHVGFSRAAVRLVAGAGAALLPAIWTGADLPSTARPALLIAASARRSWCSRLPRATARVPFTAGLGDAFGPAATSVRTSRRRSATARRENSVRRAHRSASPRDRLQSRHAAAASCPVGRHAIGC